MEDAMKRIAPGRRGMLLFAALLLASVGLVSCADNQESRAAEAIEAGLEAETGIGGSPMTMRGTIVGVSAGVELGSPSPPMKVSNVQVSNVRLTEDDAATADVSFDQTGTWRSRPVFKPGDTFSYTGTAQATKSDGEWKLGAVVVLSVK